MRPRPPKTAGGSRGEPSGKSTPPPPTRKRFRGPAPQLVWFDRNKGCPRTKQIDSVVEGREHATSLIPRGGLCDGVAPAMGGAEARSRGPGLDPCKSATGETLAALVDPKRPGARSRRSLGIQSRQQISTGQEITTTEFWGKQQLRTDTKHRLLMAGRTRSTMCSLPARTQSVEQEPSAPVGMSSVPPLRMVEIGAAGCRRGVCEGAVPSCCRRPLWVIPMRRLLMISMSTSMSSSPGRRAR
jgi:hypothetical protein